MRKVILFIAAILLIACNNNDPEVTHQVTFRMPQFTAETESMAPRRAPIMDDSSDGVALTDIYVFDGTSQLAHQTSDDKDFGTITLNLTHGNHNLSFVATRSTDITVNNGIMTLNSVRPTFGKLLLLNVSASTGAQDLTLDRITGLLSITINDVFPTTANEIEFIMNPRYNQLDITTLQAVNGASWSQRVSCTAKQGQDHVNYKFNHVAPSLTDEYISDLTINIYNAGGSVIYSVTIDDVRLATNTKTKLSGNLFTAPSADVSINHSWNSDIEGTW